MQPTSPLQNLSYWLLLLLCAAASIMEGSPTVSSLGHICTEQGKYELTFNYAGAI